VRSRAKHPESLVHPDFGDRAPRDRVAALLVIASIPGAPGRVLPELHVYCSGLYCLFFAAYNLLTLFLYRQLRSYGRDRGKEVTRTISRLVDEMLDDLARLDRSPWNSS